jgi:hypothetical protein
MSPNETVRSQFASPGRGTSQVDPQFARTIEISPKVTRPSEFTSAPQRLVDAGTTLIGFAALQAFLQPTNICEPLPKPNRRSCKPASRQSASDIPQASRTYVPVSIARLLDTSYGALSPARIDTSSPSGEILSMMPQLAELATATSSKGADCRGGPAAGRGRGATAARGWRRPRRRRTRRLTVAAQCPVQAE